MATDNIRIFFQRVVDDATLQEQIKALAGQDAAQAEAAVMKLAAEQGLPFTAEELQAFAAEEAKAATQWEDLSDSDLEQVAGGELRDMIALSVFAVGIGCLFSLAVDGVKKLANQGPVCMV